MSRVLVAEDSATQAQQIQFLLEDAGFEVELAPDGAQAVEAAARRLPDIVVTDLEMPKVNGLQLVEALRQQHPGLPVVLMTAYGSEEIAALALQKGATSYVPKRYLQQDIVATLGNILAVLQADRQHLQALEFLTRSATEYILPNEESAIPPFVGHLEEQLKRMRFADPSVLVRVCVALREALINAMHHGNLEVSSAGREADDRTYYGEVEARRQQEPYRSRVIHATVTLTRRRAEFAIRDEGPGFDPDLLPDATAPANLEKTSGRGLLLMRTFMDEVHFSETGNAVTLIKHAE